MKKLLPIIMLFIGIGAGTGAGVFLRPEPPDGEPSEQDLKETKTAEKEETDEKPATGGEGKQYIKLKNQFVIPIVDVERITSMVVMTLSVEVPEGRGQAVYDIEPKIRDVFLRVLFDFGTVGQFNGAFASNASLDVIRNGLREAAFREFGSDLISDVLIFEIARQDY